MNFINLELSFRIYIYVWHEKQKIVFFECRLLCLCDVLLFATVEMARFMRFFPWSNFFGWKCIIYFYSLSLGVQLISMQSASNQWNQLVKLWGIRKKQKNRIISWKHWKLACKLLVLLCAIAHCANVQSILLELHNFILLVKKFSI